MNVHYAHNYLRNPLHKITIDLVGMGGTGSQVLTSLARMNESLVALSHPGFHVRAWDSDMVAPSNIGRQLFSNSDLNQNKATVLITRVNRYFGYEWEARAEQYLGQSKSNIVITCVDTAQARIKIGKGLRSGKSKSLQPTDLPLYWLDLGNLQFTGQAVLGTLGNIQQPKSEHKTRISLPTVLEKFPQLKRIKEANQGPSCSLAEALERQDLFINSAVAQFGCNLLWKLFREGMIRYCGCFINLESLIVNPIKIS